jgi:transcriptional regulator with XRE-family HTH domain
MNNRLELLRRMVAETSQARVAREIGMSPAAINQAVQGKYQGDVEKLLTRVAERYGAETTVCPVLGEITLGRCADERKRPFAASSPLRVRIYRACKQCDNNRR